MRLIEVAGVGRELGAGGRAIIAGVREGGVEAAQAGRVTRGKADLAAEQGDEAAMTETRGGDELGDRDIRGVRSQARQWKWMPARRACE